MHLDFYRFHIILLATSALCLQVKQVQSSIDSTKTICGKTFVIFKSSGIFSVPCGVNRVRVLVVGGGGGGGSGAAGGGAAGFVKIGVIEVEDDEQIKVTVGKGGRGSSKKNGNCTQDSSPGERSSFGKLLRADGGGKHHNGTCAESWKGATGGSGGGEGCRNLEGRCRSGAGGSDGSIGNKAESGTGFGSGGGQGSFNEQLNQFIFNTIMAGPGGRGRLYFSPGGGGAGGILINSEGAAVPAGSGQKPYGSDGGRGYGAGGGSGFLEVDDEKASEIHHEGGNGADGVVYIEWGQSLKSSYEQPKRNCSASFALFTEDGTFTVPCGISRVRVLAVGGGSGGGSGNGGGGASGYVKYGEFPVLPGISIPVTVGAGGTGSTFKVNNFSQNANPGGHSSFGAYLKSGGGGLLCETFVGASGGSGGGEGCNGFCWSGSGGTDGSNGNATNDDHCYGIGQGSFKPILSLFRRNDFNPGRGGQGVYLENPGGGGGGGVLINGKGPIASGGTSGGAFGGAGYGAGGGAGHKNRTADSNGWNYHPGGHGTRGFVYVEWNTQIADFNQNLINVVDQTSNIEKSGECSLNFAVFKSSGTFVVPCRVRRVRVLAVGGGGGGLSCCFGGGGSGYVRSGDYDVTPGQSVSVAIGAGGDGSTYKIGSFTQDSKAGGTSSFGALLSAAGGEGRSGTGSTGAAGGSGGGDGYGCGPGTSGAGGTDGSNGSKNPSNSCGYGVGSGQGSFGPHLQLFTRNRLTPGAGGSGRSTSQSYYAGGGGGGGVVLNGSGPTAQAGTHSSAGGFGGYGFGAGGGAGGYFPQLPSSFLCYAGGRGADGLVYVEW